MYQIDVSNLKVQIYKYNKVTTRPIHCRKTFKTATKWRTDWLTSLWIGPWPEWGWSEGGWDHREFRKRCRSDSGWWCHPRHRTRPAGDKWKGVRLFPEWKGRGEESLKIEGNQFLKFFESRAKKLKNFFWLNYFAHPMKLELAASSCY